MSISAQQRPPSVATERSAPQRTVRSERTRDKLLTAAREVFVERGYNGATMDLVAERAGTARTTVFNHFSSKADLLRSVVVRESAELVSVLARARGNTGTRLLTVLRAWGRSYDRDPVAAGALVQGWFAVQASGEPRAQTGDDAKAPLHPELLASVLAGGQAAGEISRHTDIELAAAALFDACIGALARLTTTPAKGRRPSAARVLVTIGRHFADGLVVNQPA